MLILVGLYCFRYNGIVQTTQYKAEEILEALRKELTLEFHNSLSFSIYTEQQHFRLFNFSLHQLAGHIHIFIYVYLYLYTQNIYTMTTYLCINTIQRSATGKVEIQVKQ